MALALLAAAAPVGAQVYKHVDADGNVTFTNVPVAEGYELQWNESSPVARGGAPVDAAEAPASAAAGETTSYEYDRAGRLSTVRRDGTSTSFQYDANNNLVGKRRGDGQTTTYDIGPNNQVRRMTVREPRR